MATEDPPKKKAEPSARLGATGEAVRANIRRLRDAQGISAAELSRKLRGLERPIPLIGIQRIEAGTRRVDADDLVAIAVALGVSPTTLLMPVHDDDKTLVTLTGVKQPVTARAAWHWLNGQDPITITADSTTTRFRAFAWPVFIQNDHERLIQKIDDLELRAQGVRSLPDGDDK
ncbi:helix-turn-helix domain-containing protein [Mycolicibacterium porcinum]|uniref:Helix-turn-helix transcriptional regulator n=1 Tax=Mycolicibacterium porcinum TaxID=39693 RepID=A0ABV3VEP7_9MYCO